MNKVAVRNEFLVIGSAHWDILGQASRQIRFGDDLPGRIRRRTGGVALNTALALRNNDLQVSLITAVGADSEGARLVRQLEKSGLNLDGAVTNPSAATDHYMAIEDRGALVAAVADCRCLELSQDGIFKNASLWLRSRIDSNRVLTVIADGNLSAHLLTKLCAMRSELEFELVYLAASPLKTGSALPLSQMDAVTMYLNRREAESILAEKFTDSGAAAESLLAAGFERVIVTDGRRAASDGDRNGVISAAPVSGLKTGVTGAGDRFAAAHIAAVRQGLGRRRCLEIAHRRASCGKLPVPQ